MKWIKQYIINMWHRTEGYMTIEITMIFTVIFFSLLLIMFMGMVLYQEVNLQSLTVQASERGSVIYSSRVSDMSTGIKTLEDFENRDPYRNVPFMDGGAKEDYRSLVNNYVAGNLGKRDVIKGTVNNSGNYVIVQDYLVAKKIKVNIQTGYEMPIGSIAEMFGHEGPFDVNTTAVSVVADAPDFVRNVDIASDVVKSTSIFGDVQNGYNKIREAVQRLTDLVK